ncbi:1-acyl-sn-glycerol-3-phosphate acyltransferase [Leptolyngbya sp. BC1307]|uniref:1-acyl-sn-glycerol-3-phosphate acyltransferase n=1 Tax=Leptolyngbya sp. BC1307 TaxID=2029589 RepID=UPI000EFC9AA7|nr:1-acyl-sn-glycerol-3-phosphate acyltransferase [Leptolyngbya sp. BC1307]
MSPDFNHAQPALEFIQPCYSPWLRRAMQPLMPVWTAWQTNVAEIETRQVEALATLYRDFKAGKTRFLIAFRHPSPTDPYVLSHVLWQDLPQTARAMGFDLGTTHTHFIYDRGIPLWAGSYLSWVFSHLGGVPIQRGKLDILALKTARSLFVDGQFPLAAAPEGGNNGHNEIVSPLEPGMAQMAFWCAEDLQTQGRAESVVILPVGIQYRYLAPPWERLSELIAQLEADTGLGLPTKAERESLPPLFESDHPPLSSNISSSSDPAELYGRLYRLAEHLLTLMEGYYREFYGVEFDASEGETEPNAQLAERLQNLMDKALRVAEDYFDLRPKGSIIDRCRRLEQAGWNRIFRADANSLSPVARGLADRVAEEADLRMWHMRLMESFVAVTGHYVKDHPSADRFAETTLLLRDMVNRIKGKPIDRSPLGPQKAIVTVGQPIAVDQRLADYRSKRKRAIATLTQDLQAEMAALILTD